MPQFRLGLVLRPGRCQDLLLVTAQAPGRIRPQRRGSSTRAGEPDPVSIRPQMAGERRGNPSKPSNSLFSQFDIPARAGAGGSGEQQALTGSSQLSSKKLQFCKQSSAAPLGPAGKGPGPPTPDSSPHLQIQGEIHLCHHQHQREERLCGEEGDGEAASLLGPSSCSLTGTQLRCK